MRIEAPEDAEQRVERIDGSRYELDAADVPAALVYTRLLTHFGTRLDREGWGWLVVRRMRLGLGDDIITPDLSGWRTDGATHAGFARITLPPDWICEVLSPSTQKYDRQVKLPKLAGHGVEWAWLLHPRKRTLETFRARDGIWEPVAMHQGDVVVRAEPFADAELDLGRLWSGLPPAGVANEEPAEYAP